jgi:uncharacterized protein (DUF2384 family)
VEKFAFPDEQWLNAGEIAKVLLTTKAEFAKAVDVPLNSVRLRRGPGSVEAQTRLRDMIHVLDKVGPRFGSLVIAYAWIRCTPLPAFGGNTAMDLIREGRAGDVLTYIDAVDAGVFA